MVRSPVLHPPNESLLVHAGPVTSIITHIIIGTIRSREEGTETQGGCRGSHSYNCRTGGVMGKWRVKSARWARAVAARELRRWPRDGDASSRTIHQGKSGKRSVKATAHSGGHCGEDMFVPSPPATIVGTPADRPSYIHAYFHLSRMLKFDW